MKKCCSTQAISGVSSLHVWHGTLVLRSGFLLLEKSKDLQTSAVQLKKAWDNSKHEKLQFSRESVHKVCGVTRKLKETKGDRYDHGSC